VFITSTTKGVVPIVAIDGEAVGDGQVGEVTRSLGAVLAERSKAASQALD
jgi:branched-subunit amino acid aminotransferase/4-amino-4-deoxychorismate lyase